MNPLSPAACIAVGAVLAVFGALQYRFRDRLDAFYWRMARQPVPPPDTPLRKLNRVGSPILVMVFGLSIFVTGVIKAAH